MPSSGQRCTWQRSLTAAVLLSLGIFLIGCNGAGGAASTSGSQSANDPPPSLAISSSSPLPQGQVAVQYQFQFTVTGGTSPYTWQLASGSLAPGLSMGSGSGSVSGTPQKSGSYSFTVEVQDSNGHTAQAQFSQAIAPPALAVSTSSLAQGMVASAYSASLAATGGTTPYGWQIASGQLPPGLGLTSDGKISGTPTASGQYNFTAQVSDSSSPVQTASAKLSITIVALALTIGTAALPTGTLNSAYTAALSGSGGTTPYTWSVASGSLPAGLSLSSSGQISGTPTTTGTSSFTVQVADSSSPAQATTASESIQVNPVKLDAYGGRTDITCSTGATGYWSTQLVGSRWWFCDPLGNVFSMHAVEGVDPGLCHVDAGGRGCSISNFGGTGASWAAATIERLKSWGFNTLGAYSNPVVRPWNSTEQMPLLMTLNNMMFNPGPPFRNFGISQPVKLPAAANSPYYTGWVASGGYPADIYDPNMWQSLKNELSDSSGNNWAYVPPSDQKWVIGWFSDDSDLTFGLINSDSPNYRGYGSGPGQIYGWQIAIVSPLQYANKNAPYAGALYPNPEVYVKNQWQSYLEGKYSTISALNSAWGSNYTTFGSSGTQITGELVGTGDGTTAGFSHTLAKLTPSAYSVAVYDGSSLVGGDDGHGNLWGPNLTGTINYSTGALSVTFGGAATPSSAPGLSAQLVSGLSAATYYVKFTYVTPTGETAASPESSKAESNGYGVYVYAPNAEANASGWNVYVGTSSGGETRQNSAPLPFGVDWIEPSTGLTSSGATPPVTNASGAPAPGAAIAVSYVQNGWCIGTGLMDECDQPAHASWMGTDTTGSYLTGANANTIADMKAFSKAAAAYYLSRYRSTIQAAYPHALFFGPDQFTGAGSVPRSYILQAAVGNVDAIELVDDHPQGGTATNGAFPQTYLDDIHANAGDLPFFVSFYTAADADSELNGYKVSNIPTVAFPSQAARGEYYESTVATDFSASYSDGVYPFVGTNFWRYYDDWSEMTNWGLVTARDNAYDGHEDTGSAVQCSSPISQYTCGNDLQTVTFGDLIDYLKQGNAYWLSH